MTQHTCIHKNASPQLATNDLKYASMNIETPWLSSEQGGILRYSRRGSGHCWTMGQQGNGHQCNLGQWGTPTKLQRRWASPVMRRCAPARRDTFPACRCCLPRERRALPLPCSSFLLPWHGSPIYLLSDLWIKGQRGLEYEGRWRHGFGERARAVAGRERALGGGFCCDARQNRCCRSRSIPPAIWFPNASAGVYMILEHALLPSWEEATAKRLARRNYIGKYNKP